MFSYIMYVYDTQTESYRMLLCVTFRVFSYTQNVNIRKNWEISVRICQRYEEAMILIIVVSLHMRLLYICVISFED